MACGGNRPYGPGRNKTQMSDTDGKKPLGLGGNRPGQVKQSFSHGRTKSVVVETKRKRVVVPKPGAPAAGDKPRTPTPENVARAVASSTKRPAGISDAEMERRLRALAAAKAREVEEAATRAAEEKAREEERERRRAEIEAKEREDREREEMLRAKEEEDTRKAEEAKLRAQKKEEVRKPTAAAPAAAPADAAAAQAAAARAETKGVSTRPARPDREVRPDDRDARNKNNDRDARRTGKLSVTAALAGEGGRQRSMAAMKRKQERAKQKAMGQSMRAEKQVREVQLPEAIVVSELANRMAERAADVVKALMKMGMMVTMNQSIDADTAELVIEEFGHRAVRVSDADVEQVIDQVEDKPENLVSRPPIITIMGHVDHGKTSLLDKIRHANVVSGEAGGITQHIGAYQVTTESGAVLSFLDTPGHEAFTTIRARGAKVTDIVVLVVAADDGVMEQTKEAVSHSKAAGVPIVVAVNKMDKEGADPDRVKRELSDLGLMPEDWGGDTIFAHVSAKKRQGLDELLELILLQAEVLDLKANPDKPGRGHVVEAKLDKGRGPVGTVLIQEGQISQGDAFVCGLISGKVRAMFDDQGRQIKTAGPAIPTEIQGFEGIPEAGDEFVIVKDEKVARKIAEDRRVKHRDKELAKESKVTLESFLATKAGEEAQNLNLLLKADVQGSLEAISEALRKLSTDEIKIVLIHGGAGAITESDILLASASNAIIIGFNIRPTAKIKEVAEQEKVDIRFYDIIYKLVDDIKAAMSGMLSPDIKEVYLGQADVQQIFSVPKIGNIAGCMVSDGKLKRNAGIRLLRNGVVIYTGKLSSLRRFKDDAKEVTKGYDCGAGLENFNDVKIGDIIEAFELVEEARTI